MVTLDGRHVRPTHRVSRGQEIVLTIPPESREELQPEDRPVSFVHVDEFIAVVNKAPGVVVHPAAGNRSGTLVNALLFHLGALPAEGQEDRPGIVHRLDKGTSGLLVVARTPEALHFLQLEFAQRRVQKEYLAITAGVPRGHSGTVTAAIGRDETKRKKMAVKAYGGRKAVTRYEERRKKVKSRCLPGRLCTRIGFRSSIRRVGSASRLKRRFQPICRTCLRFCAHAARGSCKRVMGE
jgi:23S rRNA pseudouridine1911/1915/1917 synthase